MPCGREQLARATQTRLQEREVVAEGVVVAEALQQPARVAMPAEAGARAWSFGILGAAHLELLARLRAARVERRVHVDQVEAGLGQRREHGQVVTGDDQVVVERDGGVCGLDTHWRLTIRGRLDA